MILYNSWCGGLNLLFSQHAWWGSPISKGFPFGLVSFLIAFGIRQTISKEDLAYITARETFMIHPYPYQLFAYLVGFVIIFRTQQSYQRFWEARSQIQQMASKWIDAVVMTLAFDRPNTYESYELFMDHVKFAYRLVEYSSLMHALAMMDVRMDTNLENLRFERMPMDKGTLSLYRPNGKKGKSVDMSKCASFEDDLAIYSARATRDSVTSDHTPIKTNLLPTFNLFSKDTRSTAVKAEVPLTPFAFAGSRRHSDSGGGISPFFPSQNGHQSSTVDTADDIEIQFESDDNFDPNHSTPKHSDTSGDDSSRKRRSLQPYRMSCSIEEHLNQKELLKQVNPTMSAKKMQSISKKFSHSPFIVITCRDLANSQELDELLEPGVGTGSRVMMCMTYIQMEIMRRLKNKQFNKWKKTSTLKDCPPPIVSRIHQVLSDGSYQFYSFRKK